ncbi:hypothetical protein LAZ67_23001490, partial [Cordylochernes scorpioides]
MPQPLYSPDLAPCDFFLFSKLKRPMKGRRYATLDEIKTASKEELKKILKNDFLKCFEDWKNRWHKCIISHGDYFEGAKIDPGGREFVSAAGDFIFNFENRGREFGSFELDAKSERTHVPQVESAVPLVYVALSTAFLALNLGLMACGIFYGAVLLMVAAHRTGSRPLCLGLAITIVTLLSLSPYFTLKKVILPEAEVPQFLFDVGLSWLSARCLSFALDRLENGTYRYLAVVDLVDILAYCLYLPVLFSGPVILYDHFLIQ